MIAANETMADLLHAAGRSCIRRVVGSPERWPRIVELVSRYGTQLPSEPDSAALSEFLHKERTADPVHYPDIALAIIKLTGAGEYSCRRATTPSRSAISPSPCAITPTPAPNRRFADLINQRLVKLSSTTSPRPTPTTSSPPSRCAAICRNTPAKKSSEPCASAPPPSPCQTASASSSTASSLVQGIKVSTSASSTHQSKVA
jgi:exoribonuclease R